MAASLFCRLANDLKWNGGNEADISRVQAKLSDLLDMLSSFTKTDEILATYNQAMRKF